MDFLEHTLDLPITPFIGPLLPEIMIYSCGHAYKSLTPVATNKYCYKPFSRCYYCRQILMTVASIGVDPSNPFQPDFTNHRCHFFAKFKITEVHADSTVDLSLEEEYAHYYDRQIVIRVIPEPHVRGTLTRPIY